MKIGPLFVIVVLALLALPQIDRATTRKAPPPPVQAITPGGTSHVTGYSIATDGTAEKFDITRDIGHANTEDYQVTLASRQHGNDWTQGRIIFDNRNPSNPAGAAASFELCSGFASVTRRGRWPIGRTRWLAAGTGSFLKDHRFGTADDDIQRTVLFYAEDDRESVVFAASDDPNAPLTVLFPTNPPTYRILHLGDLIEVTRHLEAASVCWSLIGADEGDQIRPANSKEVEAALENVRQLGGRVAKYTKRDAKH